MEAENQINRDSEPLQNDQTPASTISHTQTITTTTTNRNQSTWLTNATIFQLLLAYRLLNALLLRTYFQPDEYYQALEPAWHLVFGGDQTSAAWITWEWRQHIRSALHPSLFALVYKLADLITRENPVFSLSAHTRAEVLLVAPKVLQAGIAAMGDYYTWRLGALVYGRDSASGWATLILSVGSPWLWYCSTRTFSNCAEGTLTVLALGEWPWGWCVRVNDGEEGEGGRRGMKGRSDESRSGRSRVAGLRKALVFAAIATVLRPTNILIWASVAVYTIFKAFTIDERGGSDGSNSAAGSVRKTDLSAWSKGFLLIREAIICGTLVLTVSAVIDRLFYGSWTFPPYNFLYFNVFQSLAIFYGNNNWHFYLTSGYSLLLTMFAPFIAACSTRGFKDYAPFATLSANSKSILRGLSITCITLPAALSILNHKEVRFIHPILPLLLVIAGMPASEFKLAFTTRSISAVHVREKRRKQRIAMVLFLVTTAPIMGYITRLHSSGPLSISEYLRHEFEQIYLPRSSSTSETSSNTSMSNSQPRNMTVAFLMPCHSVPWRSHLQYPPTESQIGIQAWALTCEPPLHLTDPSEKATYMDEADIFYDNPRAWIRRNMARDLPSKPGSENTGRNVEPGVHVAEEALEHRNKKLWTGSRSSKDIESHSGLDITDLLPYLSTSPSSPSSNLTSSPSSSLSNSDTNITTSLSTSNPFPHRRPWPDYIVFFAQLRPCLCSVMSCYGPGAKDVYSQCWRGFNGFSEDWRRKGDVVVWCLKPRCEGKVSGKGGTEGIEGVEGGGVGADVKVGVDEIVGISGNRSESKSNNGSGNGIGVGHGHGHEDL